MTRPQTSIVDSPYQQTIAQYWNTEKNPVNLLLGEVDGLYHHHYGIGAVDWSVLDAPPDVRDQRVIEELHRLETAQADVLLDNLGPIAAEDRLLDSGCGRGGSSVMAHRRFGCDVDGVSISQAQVDFANGRAGELGIAGNVQYHLKNMLETGFDTGAFGGIWNNESTMYVDLSLLFEEYRRLLRRGGRYVCITGCYNDTYGLPSRAVSTINAHYICDIHPRSTYFRELAAHRLVPVSVIDLTAATIPYWELRAKSALATGIEQAFLDAYRDGSFQYLLIAADRI